MTIQKKSALTLRLKTDSDDGRPVYIAGNFNDWKVGDVNFRMERTGAGKYEFTFPEHLTLPLPLEYKYTKGTWRDVELDDSGQATSNRVLTKARGKIKDTVPCWQGESSATASFMPHIRIISNEFEMPQLGKKRRIAAILPHDYFTSNKHYPVLYLQDGQNLYDDFAPFGNWAVNKRMAALAEKGKGDLIIIAIDHGGTERIAEFTPYATKRFSRADGRQYVRFLVETLKPYVDANFRTLPGREHTGVGGSSMGGLISIYCGLLYPNVFNKLMVFSPSLWVNPHLHFEAMQFRHVFDTRIYLYAGEREGGSTVPLVQHFKRSLEQRGLDGTRLKFKLSIDPHGRHNEARWGREFPKAVRWLYFGK